jgi:D-lactate dehydrogenase (cytochrome)
MPLEIKPFNQEFEDYLRDESRRSGSADAIVFAKSEADVQTALKAARQKEWPITLQGARTGITGGAVPEGGLILNLSRMKQVGRVTENRMMVQPGALLSEIQTAVEAHGFFFPPDPTETSASIGGMLACNASGAQSFHYGSTRNWIHALRVVLADGDTLRLERGTTANGLSFKLLTESGREIVGELPNLNLPAVKSAAGYFVQPDMDLVDLFIGMEGTLGIITEAQLLLRPVPPVRQALCAFFPEEESALHFVRFLRTRDALPSPPVSIEFFDHRALDLLRRSKAENSAFSDLPELPTSFHTAIYFEFHSDCDEAVDSSVLAAAEQMMALGANEDDCWLASTPHEIEALKAFRHATPEAVNLLIDQRKKEHPGLTKLGTDMSVPDDALEEMMMRYRKDLTTAGLEHVIFGHIGNNHVHVNILPHSLEDYERGKELYSRWAETVISLGGSVSAEHGIGKIKVPLLEKMFGADGIAGLRGIQTLFDPEGILNPGNLFAVEPAIPNKKRVADLPISDPETTV